MADDAFLTGYREGQALQQRSASLLGGGLGTPASLEEQNRQYESVWAGASTKAQADAMTHWKMSFTIDEPDFLRPSPTAPVEEVDGSWLGRFRAWRRRRRMARFLRLA